MTKAISGFWVIDLIYGPWYEDGARAFKHHLRKSSLKYHSRYLRGCLQAIKANKLIAARDPQYAQNVLENYFRHNATTSNVVL